MSRYKVIMTRDITESTVIEVDAPNAEAAETEAHAQLSNMTDTEWEIDDGSWNNSDVYVTGVGEA